MMNALESTSTRPYLIRALYEWCTDNGLTPYIAVLADDTVRVPREYVENGEIVFNISADATGGLKLGNEFVEFKARFAGVAREIMVPIDRIIAIYARESGQGMAFPVAVPTVDDDDAGGADLKLFSERDAEPAGLPGPIQLVSWDAAGGDDTPTDPPPAPKRGRPALKVIK
jgi:stringent starvation protein B